MILSICPKCYEKGEVTKGRFLNGVRTSWSGYYDMYHCDKCKESYKELYKKS